MTDVESGEKIDSSAQYASTDLVRASIRLERNDKSQYYAEVTRSMSNLLCVLTFILTRFAFAPPPSAGLCQMLCPVLGSAFAAPSGARRTLRAEICRDSAKQLELGELRDSLLQPHTLASAD